MTKTQRERRRTIRREVERQLVERQVDESLKAFDLDYYKTRPECQDCKPYDKIPDPTAFPAILKETRREIYKQLKKGEVNYNG